MYLAAKEKNPLTPSRRKPVRTTRINCPIQFGGNFAADDDPDLILPSVLGRASFFPARV